jgi:parvulin-like peptidyl-prolyl isomerase
VQAEVEKLSESLGSFSKYKKYLSENYLTDNVYRENVRAEIMQSELFYAYVNDLGLIESDTDKVYDIIKEDFIRTQHIYVSKSTYGAESKIENALAELASGADFFETLKKYGEDSSQTEAGEYITRGYMSDEYEKAAYGLSIGAHSDVVESNNGYFIVKRLELDPLYVMVNLNTLTERYQRYAFLELIYEEQRLLKFEPCEYFYSLDLIDLK